MSDIRQSEYDAARIAEITDGVARARLSVLDGCNWQPSDGHIPGYFEARQAGNRCVWSCRWAMKDALYSPDQLGWPLNCMTIAELIAEAEDITSRPRVYQPEIIELLSQPFTQTAPDFWGERMVSALSRARDGFPDYCCPWSLPVVGDNGGYRLMRLVLRPGGWQDTAAVTAKVRGG
jgi:hypothetical protein